MSKAGDRRSLEVRRQVSIFDEIEAVQYRVEQDTRSWGYETGYSDARLFAASQVTCEQVLFSHAHGLMTACKGSVFADSYLAGWSAYMVSIGQEG